MKRTVKYLKIAVFLIGSAIAAEESLVLPYEQERFSVRQGEIDNLVFGALHKANVEQAPPCSDIVFVRRVFLDVIGVPPEAWEVRAFLKDARPAKRAALIDALLARDEHVDYWSMKWCDLLRVKSEFPINLWPNAAQAYQRWIQECLRSNMPYDRMARELLTSSGSNFRVPPVNFYQAIQGSFTYIPASARSVKLGDASITSSFLEMFGRSQRKSGNAGIATPVIKKPAKAVIQILMWGGPAHLDTFDPKPDEGRDYIGPYDKPLATHVDGMRIVEMLPSLAKQADKYSIIRSMTHGNNGHETAAYIVRTGRRSRQATFRSGGSDRRRHQRSRLRNQHDHQCPSHQPWA